MPEPGGRSLRQPLKYAPVVPALWAKHRLTKEQRWYSPLSSLSNCTGTSKNRPEVGGRGEGG